ncbi:putative innexin [Schistosoma mansoni]|uniref:putative innexin n=1 Tax=Schistosoma mansoni TaxID=6183 RepID=UPI00022DC1D7|nr:putative innexin [Schistosoma mansoni]|eukprot:XP_018647851.1 putative innexin [Schistosoma mansoni]
MVAQEFIDLFNSISLAQRSTVEDFADRLNLFTVILLLITCIIVSTKQYLLNSISCYIPVKPAGENFNDYLANYCWVHGTIPLADDERMPTTEAQWEEYDSTRRITYYQWVPFVLGLQCILFYIPHIAWQAACTCRSGGDMFSLVKSAADAAILSREDRQKAVARVAEFIEDMIGMHKECRTGRRAKLTKTAARFGGIFVASKRLGTNLIFSYFCVKIITIINAALQIFLIQRFLGFYSNDNENVEGYGFGLTVVNHIRAGRDWPETMLFPRVAYCRVPGIRLVGVKNSYTAQCALPINMLNEKIYIFFWFWIVFLLITCILSLLLWLARMILASKRKDFIKRYLRLKGVHSLKGDELKRSDLDEFIDKYLRADGVFIIRMLTINSGDVITGEIVTELYQNFIEHYNKADSIDKGQDPMKSEIGFKNLV